MDWTPLAQGSLTRLQEIQSTLSRARIEARIVHPGEAEKLSWGTTFVLAVASTDLATAVTTLESDWNRHVLEDDALQLVDGSLDLDSDQNACPACGFVLALVNSLECPDCGLNFAPGNTRAQVDEHLGEREA